MGRLTGAALERLERVLAWEQIRRTLDRIPDPLLVEIARTDDTEALESAGITRELIATAIGDPEDPAEQERRMGELFAVSEHRRLRCRPFLTKGAE